MNEDMALRRDINIVNTDYSRYGTSIFETLYSDDKKLKGAIPSFSKHNTSTTVLSNGYFNGKDTRNRVLRSYRSLLDNCSSPSKAKRVINKIHDHASCESLSLFYSKSIHSFLSRELVIHGAKDGTISKELRPYLDINALPIEILTIILRNLQHSDNPNDYKSLIKLLYVSKKFYLAAKVLVYESPQFTSSYRVGQFVTSIRLNPESAKLVKQLDLSQLRNGLIEDDCQKTEIITQPSNRLAERRTSNVDLREVVESDAPLPDVALATWRDWRLRFDPLYSSPILNSYNLKRIRYSNTGIGPTTSIGTSGQRKTRRSYYSISSTISSSLHPRSHSLTSFNDKSTTIRKRVKDIRWITSLFGLPKTKKHLGSRHKTIKRCREQNDGNLTVKAIRAASQHVHQSETQKSDTQRHPHANKFLLKYTVYKDIPIGYLLHIIDHCSSLHTLNISNLSISTDFEIETKEKSNPINSLILEDNHQEGSKELSEGKVGRKLQVVYLSDSDKSYEFYIAQSNSEKLHVPSTFSHQNSHRILYPNFPRPIDASTKFRTETNRSQNRCISYSLRRLSEHDIFNRLCKLRSLRHLEVNGVSWCSSEHIKQVLIHNYLSENYLLHASFKGTGLVRDAPWSSAGSIRSLVALLVLSDLAKRDDFEIENLFNVRTNFLNYGGPLAHPDMLEASNSFYLSSAITTLTSNGYPAFKLCIMKSAHFSVEIGRCNDAVPMSASDSKGFALGIKIYLGTLQNDHQHFESLSKLHTLCSQLLERVNRLHEGHRRRHIGEHYQISFLPL
ncbi:Cos111p Ecym_1178 [Eremothecium cymbalariae DBVPG|uniref:F-box domain-containing protein n=1 Tax=Eremothecium cymbalariae (strain CBS 270.75 / DBVPG 7215 / KCTC 17166 / NRRL Y-17582) TaxID=931890 RepID=G8JMW4_ERECY|nr:hypothetical protein Ecym_1178 [Eremothecium cymbalariae DBVPG\